MPEFELSVYVHEGRHFPRSDEEFYRIGGLFDDEPRSTARSLPILAATKRRGAALTQPRVNNAILLSTHVTALRFAQQGFTAAGSSAAWNVTLRWQIEPDRLRRITTLGTSQIKLQGEAHCTLQMQPGCRGRTAGGFN